MKEILLMLGLTILQNASFTLVSRARQGNSIKFHLVASVFSNTIYIIVIRNVVLNLTNPVLMATYVVGSVTGSIAMHFFSMNYVEKWLNKWNNKEANRD